MASGGMIQVDVAGLRGLASKMRMVQGSLTSDTGMFHEGANGVEHPVLRRSLNRFEERWSDRRHQIHEALGVVAKAFDTTAESFEEADQELARALKPGPMFEGGLVALPLPVTLNKAMDGNLGPIRDRFDGPGGTP